MNKYILGIDQSTSGTKAILFDEDGKINSRYDLPHRQIISEQGWVSHDAQEIYSNLLKCVKGVVDKSRINKSEIVAVGLSNQRETALIWDRKSGVPVNYAVVWQCNRGKDICLKLNDYADEIKFKTGLQLSPYFSASKIVWLLENLNYVNEQNLCAGTMDSFLLFKLTGNHFTDYSNASRTQLFNIHELKWDKDICKIFGISTDILPIVCESNADFGATDFEGFLDKPIPVLGVMGDSHGALYGQGCVKTGMIKSTYGTGSSIMMNIGSKPVMSKNGLVTSIGYCIDGKVKYVFEGNINYSAAVIKWLVDLGLIDSSKDSGTVAKTANVEDTTYLVPAFTGLGAPYWISDAKATICGMTRSTGKAEIVRAAEDSIAYQIADVINLMLNETGIKIKELRVDGGATKDSYLMQFQSDILDVPVSVPSAEELSAIGPAYAAGIKAGLYSEDVFNTLNRTTYKPLMKREVREQKYLGWKEAVENVISVYCK